MERRFLLGAGSRVLAACWLLVLSVVLPCYSAEQEGALEQYVRASDAHFRWRQAGRQLTNGFTITQLELVSQKWREHVWDHQVQLVAPPVVRNPDIAFLFVTGDGSGRGTLGLLRTVAERSGALAAVVTRVPNQPLYDGRKEDALIAFTFDQYLKTGDKSWPLLFPMVKSAVRAMDAITACRQEQGQPKLDRFVVGGASKRGWTTWLTGAVDPRVQGIAPMVIDMLNMKAQTRWAERVYGRQSDKIRDYTDLNLIARMDDPAMVRLRDWVDPYSYRPRYRMPKLILLGTNDPYWTVDSLRHYWDDLPESKLVFQTPNAGHDLGGGRDATQTLAAFVQMIADRQPLPTASWQFMHGPQPELSFTLSQPVKRMRLWSASSADRDFRDEQWTMRELPEAVDKRQCSVALEPPEKGYRAFLAEAVLSSPTGHDYMLSTKVSVIPDTVQ